jgi:hypothetical protein
VESVKTRGKGALPELMKTDITSEEADISIDSTDEGPEGSFVFEVQAVKMKTDLLTEESGQYSVCCSHCLTVERFLSSKHF